MPTLLEGDKKLRPLDPGEQVKNPDGTVSTERTVSYEHDGQFIVVPRLWMSQRGVVDFGDDDRAILNSAFEYEKRTGKRFPRFKTAEELKAFEAARTQSGGAASGSLAR